MPQAQPEAEDVHHEDEERQMSLLDQYVAKAAAGQSAKRTMEPKDPKKRLGEGAIELDPKKLKAALDMQKGKESNDQQSQYNSLGGSQSVTEETLEAYRMEKVRPNDPMADYVDHPDQEF